MHQNIRSPFKFLDPYSRGDQDIFFGRKEEVETLYQYVNKNRKVLVYGQSGTGKTSLIQCGLANRFEVTDWLPFFIRRGSDINQSLNQALGQSKAIGGSVVTGENLLPSIQRISARYLRPVYLIFDQFEELLILGEAAEKEQFTKTIKAILASEQTESCNLLFILREEYFAWLDTFEREIPGFSDRRLRVEPMRLGKLEEVIMESCSHFKISLEKGAENARQIIKNLWGKGGVQLPYLQVYLDMLWREDFARTYPDGWQGKGYAPLEITTNEINHFGAIKDVLARFLTERIEAIQRELAIAYPGLASDSVRKVLDAFVTDEGTKQPVPYMLNDKIISPAAHAPDQLNELPLNILTDCLKSLERSRILRADEDNFELAHDSLAALIDLQRTDEQRQLNDIRSQIKNSYRIFSRTGDYLSAKQLIIYEDFLPLLKLEDKLLRFVEKSKVYKQEQEIKKEKERNKTLRIVEAELAAQKKARKRGRLILIVLGIAFLVAAGIGLIAYSQYQIAQQRLAEKEAEEQKRISIEIQELLQQAETFKLADELELAMRKLQTAWEKDSTNEEVITEIKQLKTRIEQK